MSGAWSADWPAPGKLNLFLHVTGRRDDGYHTLQTAFQLLDHGDRLDFRVRRDGVVRRVAGPEAVAPEADLAVRAARGLQAATGTALGAEIRVHKRLPIGGGLGGGSSDAATALVALNALWGTGCTPEELAAIGVALGADVPVFVHGRSAWGEGIGERLTPIGLPPSWYLVVDPGVAVSTAEVFAAPELTRNAPPIKITALRAGRVRNDCEAVVVRRHAEVGRALEWLRSKGRARLTGTGGCCFVALSEARDARDALAELPGDWRGFVARGVDRSPLHERLDRPG